jgi:hypothetical protein
MSVSCAHLRSYTGMYICREDHPWRNGVTAQSRKWLAVTTAQKTKIVSCYCTGEKIGCHLLILHSREGNVFLLKHKQKRGCFVVVATYRTTAQGRYHALAGEHWKAIRTVCWKLWDCALDPSFCEYACPCFVKQNHSVCIKLCLVKRSYKSENRSPNASYSDVIGSTCQVVVVL